MNAPYQRGPRIRFGVDYSCLFIAFVIAAIIYGAQWVWSKTKILLGFPTPTPYVADCHSWEDISYSMVGKYECVYGYVVSMVNDGTHFPTVLNFTNNSGAVYLLDNEHYYPDIAIGTCVEAEEYIQSKNGNLFMRVSNIFNCNFANSPGYQNQTQDNPTSSFAPTSTLQPTPTIIYRPITWMELVSFIEDDRTNSNTYDPDNYVCIDFAIDLVANAAKKNIKAWVVGVEFGIGEEGHAFTAFETTDRGIVYIEPQTDIPYMQPIVGQPLCDGWTGANCMGTVSSIEYAQCDHSHYCTSYIP